MEVKLPNDGLLTNREVLDLLEERRSTRAVAAHGNALLQDREHIEKTTMKYLNGSAIKNTTSETVIRSLNAIKRLGLGLTEAEMIQIANHVPMNEVEIYLLIEECAERLQANQIALIIDTIKSMLENPVDGDKMDDA